MSSHSSGSVCHHDECPPFGCMKSPSKVIQAALENDRLVAALPADTCEDCGKKAELRPYGPNGERVCFQCGMKDETAMKRAAGRRFR